MNASEANQRTDLLLLSQTELTKSGGYHIGACPFCGGKDRFVIKHFPHGDRWLCRQCSDNKYHTAIDFIMKRDNCNFKEAIKLLDCNDAEKICKKVYNPFIKQPAHKINIPSLQWQKEALYDMLKSEERLQNSSEAQDFLSSRNICPSMQLQYHLGFRNSFDISIQEQRPSITIPWLINPAMITALKYRFIDKRPEGLRYSCRGGMNKRFALGSCFDIPYGLHISNEEQSDSLLFVEGEINCISIKQLCIENLSVLSFGSEGSGEISVLNAIANKYKNVYVWADDIQDNPKQIRRAENLQSLVKGYGIMLKSKKDGSIKKDANQMLQEFILLDFLKAETYLVKSLAEELFENTTMRQ